MLYYHFTDKAALYRGVIGEMFGSIVAALTAVREAGGPPERQLQAFIAAIAREGQARPHFPSIWLRELADGGRHLGERNFNDMVAIIGALVAEFVSAERGLGYIIVTAQGQFRTDLAFAAIFLLGVIGLALFYLLAIAEKILLPWLPRDV